MSVVKQVIVVRKDLNMRKGKIAAQVAHAAIKVFFDRMKIFGKGRFFAFAIIFRLTKDMILWMQNDFTKVVVSVNTEDEIYELADKAREAGLPYAVMIDNGFTEFHREKTVTCIAIGPAKNEDLDPITGDLKLL